jgi:hypothetical protein
MSFRPRAVSVLLAVLFLSCFLSRQAGAVSQWRRWEQALTSPVDYSLNGGNPYRDLVLRIRFTGPSGQTFTQDAFWEGARQFKVRTALPAGTWTWQIASCTGTTVGQACSASGWSPSSGSIAVTASTSSGIRLYDRGFPAQLQSSVTGAYSQILYGDYSTSFYWAGDTAWAAPAREITGQTAQWSTFLADRKAKGFTMVLVAPAVAWTGIASPTDSFVQSGCTGPIPNDCSMPKVSYWQAFDNLVEQANQKDITVVVAGVIDPNDLGAASSPKYPNPANAEDFARYLAARLAGNAVIFSPGFDDKPSSTTANGSTVQTSMNTVGAALKAAAPRHLVTNHLGGTSTSADYQAFKSSGWMSFYLFQSGHAKNQNGVASQPCPGWLSTEIREQAALRRASQMPMTLNTYSGPAMPSVNGEGPYDDYPSTTDPVDNRYRVRQAGHTSSLSNAQGFTYGMTNLGIWSNPGTLFSAASSSDMQQLILRFKNRAGLPSHPEWIVTATTDPKKMMLASDGASLVLAYLPVDGDTSSITMNTSALPGVSCSGAWTYKWFDPTTNLSPVQNPPCSSTASQISLSKPQCNKPEGCDWIVEVQRTGAALSGSSASLAQDRSEPWADFSSTDGTSAIRVSVSRLPASTAWADLVISPPGESFQESPRIARMGTGYFVVWQADGLDGSLEGIFAQRLDWQGGLVGDRIQINTFTEHDQRDPAIASDPQGNVIVVWSSYHQDGDLGGIYGQRFDSSGKPLGGELSISVLSKGHPTRPQVGSDATGNFVVAWETESGFEEGGSVSLRKFSRTGAALSDEIRIPQDTAVFLVDLQVAPLGNFSVRWARRASTDVPNSHAMQQFDAAGPPIGNEVVLK